MAIIDNAVYVDGKRTKNPESLDLTYEVMRERGGTAWIGLYRPGRAEIDSVAAEFSLHHLPVEDAIAAHQRPKLEGYGDQLFMVLRPARYIEATEKVEFGEVHVFVGPDFVVTIRHAEAPDLGRVRHRLEDTPELLGLGTDAVLYAIIDQVVDEYEPVIDGLQTDIDEIEDQLFTGQPEVARRIYDLSREVMEFQRATAPLVVMVEALREDAKADGNLELRRSFRDVLDHILRVTERADAFRMTLQNALTVHATLVTQQQNEEIRAMTQVSIEQNEQVKKISAWGAILFAPTLIAGIYGMNFEHMPELRWLGGYPMAVLAMVTSSIALYVVFRRQRWL
ncbi:magnesium and cobalt transport protein CorA [Williamsia sp. 1135]|uniref:magnesium and cobalt transport protein CorA n=1 Tax=Williamsia sp. 1135 TaxID=1889262 RepID=UPI000A0FBAC8|nr:magnesium and cobalt transport protein CorA [Williamsia sp. 1135]ORM36867.1 transporter [Williamsia sp. 1135]